jgi:membrane fusion protein (multidrug efflux system)
MRSTVVGAAVFLGVAAVAGGLTAYKVRALSAEAGGGWEPAESVQVVTAREVAWRPEADLVGTVRSLRSVEVQNELAGVVRAVRFESGSIIEAGEVLLTFDDAVEQADLAAAEANVRVAEASVVAADARLRLAQAELRRVEEIAQARVASEIDLDRARSELDRAAAEKTRTQAEVEAARALVGQVQARLVKRTLRAPFRGRTGLRNVHEGQYLKEGTTVVALEEVSERIYLDFAIPQDHAPRVRPGTTVMADAAVLGSDPVRIEVVALDAAVNLDTRNIRVRAVVDDPGGVLRPGMFIQIRVPVDEPRPFVVVPATAIRRSSYADQVFVIVPGEAEGQLRAKQRFVELGPTVGDDVIILDGVAQGERVAATGSFKLRDGALVTPSTADADAVAATTSASR